MPPRPSSPQPPPQPSSWLSSYETFLLTNARRLSSIESSVRSLSYLATGQMQDVELVTETLYSVLQVLGLYHDKVVNGAILKMASNGKNGKSGMNGKQCKDCCSASNKDVNRKGNRSKKCECTSLKNGSTQGFRKLICDPQIIRPSMHNRYTQWAMTTSKLYRTLSIILTLLKHTELLWEMLGKRRFEISVFGKQVSLGSFKSSGSSGNRNSSEKSRWKTVLYIEAIKALLRIGMLAATHGRTVLETPIPERDIDPERIVKDEEGNIKIMDDNELREYQQNQQNPLGQNGDGGFSSQLRNGNGGDSLNGSGWWEMPRTGTGLPNQTNLNIDDYLSKKILTVEDVKGPECLVHKLNILGLSAEVMYILRPLIYAGLLYLSKTLPDSKTSQPLSNSRIPFFKSKSKALNPWIPCLVGISIDLLSRKMLLASLKQSLPGGLRSITKLEAEELKQRLSNVAWWLLRGNFYDKLTRPAIEKVVRGIEKVPVVGIVGVLLEDYLYLFDEYYFTASTL